MTDAAKTDAMHADLRDLDEIVRRIVEVADPERILLFGSTARQSAGPNSRAGVARHSGRHHGHW